MRTLSARLLLLSLLTGASLAAAEEGEWETVATEPYLVKTRAVPNSPVHEIYAEAELNAPVRDIQETIMDADGFSKFMPYVKEARKFGEPTADGGQYTYTRLDFGALLTSRDYVTIIYLDQGVAADGTGEFKQRWVADPDKLPHRQSSIRLKVNQGSWHIVPRDDGKCFAVYRFLVDPSGWIPAWAANAGNKKGVTETLKALEKEAQRRAKERQRTEAAAASGK